MKVINLESWAGEDFSCQPGEEIDLPDAIALARIAVGLCQPLPAKPKTTSRSKDADQAII